MLCHRTFLIFLRLAVITKIMGEITENSEINEGEVKPYIGFEIFLIRNVICYKWNFFTKKKKCFNHSFYVIILNFQYYPASTFPTHYISPYAYNSPLYGYSAYRYPSHLPTYQYTHQPAFYRNSRKLYLPQRVITYDQYLTSLTPSTTTPRPFVIPQGAIPRYSPLTKQTKDQEPIAEPAQDIEIIGNENDDTVLDFSSGSAKVVESTIQEVKESSPTVLVRFP